MPERSMISIEYYDQLRQKKDGFMRHVTIVLFFILSIGSGYAQYVIHGIVTDQSTNLPLPYTNIYIQDSFSGTTSNSEGDFSLKIPRIPATLVVSYIGYETQKIRIGDERKRKYKIALNPTTIEMQRIVVTADQEDPAIGIMKKVIAKKRTWIDRLKSYKAMAYTRTCIENDTCIVSISESISNLYWDFEAGSREEFVARNSCRQVSYLAEFSPGSKNLLNFYHDDLMLLQHRFVGPTHPQALKFYDFKLADVRSLDGKAVFDIHVLPKSKLQPLFRGRISVLDEDFAMLEVDLKEAGNISFATMLRSFQGHYRQQFHNFGTDYWLPIDSRVIEAIEMDMGLIAFPRGIQKKISRISHYQINVDVSKEIAFIDSLAASKSGMPNPPHDTTAFLAFEKVPLTKEEQAIFSHPDTTLTLIKAFRPTGMLANFMIRREHDIERDLSETGSYMAVPPRSSFDYHIWFNRVEGLHLGLAVNRRLSEKIRMVLGGNYQTARKKFAFHIQGQYRLPLPSPGTLPHQVRIRAFAAGFPVDSRVHVSGRKRAQGSGRCRQLAPL